MPPQPVGRLPPDRAGALGERHHPGHGAGRRASCSPTSRARSGRSTDAQARSRADRQRRHRAARRGLLVEDHRRGGALLPHRPVDFEANVDGLAGGVRGGRADPARSDDPELADEIEQRFKAVVRRPSGPTGAASGFVLYTELTRRRQAKAGAGDRRARRAAVEGGEPDRLVSDAGAAGPHPAALLGGGAGAAGVGLGLGGRRLSGSAVRRPRPTTAPTTVPFYGAHQAGIATPAQDRLHFAAFDLTSTAAGELRELLRAWIGGGGADDRRADGRAGNDEPLRRPTTPARRSASRPPADGHLRPRPGRVRAGGRGSLRPAPPDARRRSEQLPPLPGDELDPALSGGDLCVQACADDPQVAFHAVRNLARIGRGAVVMRWSQLGFGRTSSTTSAGHAAQPDGLQGRHQQPPRRGHRRRCAASSGSGGRRPAWMRGGTYIVTRRIRMLIEIWDRSSLSRPGADDRPPQVLGRADRRARGARPGRPRRAAGRPAGDPRRRPHPPRRARRQRRRSGSCAAATRSPTAWSRSRRARRRASSSSASSATRRRSSRHPATARLNRRAERVHPAHLERRLRDPAGRSSGRLRGRGPLCLVGAGRPEAALLLSFLLRCPDLLAGLGLLRAGSDWRLLRSARGRGASAGPP